MPGVGGYLTSGGQNFLGGSSRGTYVEIPDRLPTKDELNAFKEEYIFNPYVGEYGPLPLPDFSISEFDPTPNNSDTVSEEGLYDIEQKILDSVQAQNEAAQGSADRAMEFEAEQWNDYKNWIDSQRSNAYQVAMEDMRKAGLNPKLVAKLGGAQVQGGNLPSGFTGNMQATNFAPIATVLSSYITSAASLENKDKDFLQNILSSLIKILPYVSLLK